jgi:predicted PurR-regulated permease PerM
MYYQEFVKRLLTTAFVFAGLLGLWYLREIVLLVFLSAIIAISLSVPVLRLQQMGWRRGYAIGATVLVVLIGIFAFLFWLFPVMVEQMADLAEGLPDAMDATVEEYNTWRGEQTAAVQDMLPEADLEAGDTPQSVSGAEDSAPLFDFGEVSSIALPALGDAANFALGLVAQLIIVIIVAIFFLIDPSDYLHGMIIVFPEDQRPRVLEVVHELQKTLVTWMAALSLSITLTVVLVTVVLGGILNVPNSLALGVIAGATTIIPNIGAIISIVPIIIFTLGDDPSKLPYVIIAYFAIQIFESSIITPAIVKQQLSIPPAALLIFQLIAAALFGFLGILLAVPMLATLLTLIRELYLYDVLGMRGMRMDIAQDEDGSLHVSHVDVEEERIEALFVAEEEAAAEAEDKTEYPES